MYNIEVKNTKSTYTFLFYSVYYLYNYWFSRVFFIVAVHFNIVAKSTNVMTNTKRKAKARVSNTQTHEHHFFVSHCFFLSIHSKFCVYSLLKCADKQSLIWNCYKLVDHLMCLVLLFKFQVELWGLMTFDLLRISPPTELNNIRISCCIRTITRCTNQFTSSKCGNQCNWLIYDDGDDDIVFGWSRSECVRMFAIWSIPFDAYSVWSNAFYFRAYFLLLHSSMVHYLVSFNRLKCLPSIVNFP